MPMKWKRESPPWTCHSNAYFRVMHWPPMLPEAPCHTYTVQWKDERFIDICITRPTKQQAIDYATSVVNDNTDTPILF